MFTRRRRLFGPGALLIAVAIAFPLGVLAAATFSDVPESHPFYNDVEAVAAAGVTTGCGGGKYCPDDNVTRAQMAAFMNRLGALGVGKTPVVKAKTSLSTDGWSIGCPTGSALSGGLCFDAAVRGSDDIFDASEACANLGGGIFGSGRIWRLPQAQELRSAYVNGQITISAEEWSSTTFYDGAYQGMSVDNTFNLMPRSTLTVLPYRCASIPLTRDGLIIIPLSEPQDGSDPGKVKGSDGKTNPDGSLK